MQRWGRLSGAPDSLLGGEDFLKKTAKNCGRGLATFSDSYSPMSHEQGPKTSAGMSRVLRSLL